MRARIGFLVAVAIGCSGAPAAPVKPSLSPSSPRLAAPQPIDPSRRGAAYLEALGEQIQPRWAQFLEDCRLRLPFEHPLNTPTLVATVELVIGPGGRLVERHTSQGSGNGEFDGAMNDVLGDVTPGAPPAELESDDGLVHVRWVFARDRRQAGPATAEIMRIELPLVTAVERLLERGDLTRAATRVAAAPAGADQQAHAIELVMVGALREALASSDGYTRVAALDAVDAIHRSTVPRSVPVTELAPEVHRLIGASGQTERVLAISVAASLGDVSVIPELVDDLALELERRPEIALAKLAALAVLERPAEVTRTIERVLAAGRVDRIWVVAALAIVPDLSRARDLATWFAAGPAQMREAICAALPAAAGPLATELVGKGLRSADATVRATCVAAAPRLAGTPGAVAPTIVRRLGELTRDRDQVVRARAVAALGAIDPAQRSRVARRAIADRAPQVRAAFTSGASESELRVLATDEDPDVRAAALAALGERGVALAAQAIADPASQVRRAAVAGVADDQLLVLAGDADPDVATAALVRYAMRRGRPNVATELLARLIAATPKSMERVRIARAYLLARL